MIDSMACGVLAAYPTDSDPDPDEDLRRVLGRPDRPAGGAR